MIINRFIHFPLSVKIVKRIKYNSIYLNNYRLFSEETDNDFKPRYHNDISSSKDNKDIQEMIQKHISKYPILLYMKGTPSMPQCGFSQQVVRILHSQGVDFDSINVLEHPTIREGIKKYSKWPTIPQLYVKGEFIGGCDIITDMQKTGKLTKLFKSLNEK